MKTTKSGIVILLLLLAPLTDAQARLFPNLFPRFFPRFRDRVFNPVPVFAQPVQETPQGFFRCPRCGRLQPIQQSFQPSFRGNPSQGFGGFSSYGHNFFPAPDGSGTVVANSNGFAPQFVNRGSQFSNFAPSGQFISQPNQRFVSQPNRQFSSQSNIVPQTVTRSQNPGGSHGISGPSFQGSSSGRSFAPQATEIRSVSTQNDVTSYLDAKFPRAKNFFRAITGRPPLQPESSTRLVPAKYNNNPGFQYSLSRKVSRTVTQHHKCQATLISAENGLCLAATAAHCVQETLQQNGKDFVNDLNAYTGQATLSTADFGTVNAQIFANAEYIAGPRSEDSAVLAWACNSNNGVPIIPIGESPIRRDEQLYYGKVMRAPGLHTGRPWRDPKVTSVYNRPQGEAQESVWMNNGVVTQQGDSGGGLYRETEDGLELVGVLSTGDDVTRNYPLGTYAVNRSLDFVRRLKAFFIRGAENEDTI